MTITIDSGNGKTVTITIDDNGNVVYPNPAWPQVPQNPYPAWVPQNPYPAWVPYPTTTTVPAFFNDTDSGPFPVGG